MIVRKLKTGYGIINQSTHGLISGEIALYIQPQFKNRYWKKLIIAISVHDDCPPEFTHQNHLSENGIPLDFTEDPNTVWDILRKMKIKLTYGRQKSGYIYLIFLYHLHFLYGYLSSSSKLIAQFFKEQEKVKKNYLKTYNLQPNQIKKDYEILRFCDRLSLILCKNQIPEMGRKSKFNK